jgi:urea transport system ATP-binding protein
MLTVEDLHVSYGGSLILQGVDLFVPRGEIRAIMGRNGMGKTTLLKSIMGLVASQSGKIFLEELEIQSVS